MVKLLESPAARRNLIRDIVDYGVESHEAGIVVDFEEVPDASQAHFRAFIGGLAPALHSVGLKLMIALPARDDAYDYEYFGDQCDAIVLMNYDQHWLTSPPGPIAAQDWFMENLRQVLEAVPAQKIVVGIANYAYDWAAAAKKGYQAAEEWSIQEALLHAEESDADVQFDSNSLNPHYSYYDEPDPRWTQKILDILKEKNAPGVFFVIGDPASRWPDILKREYAEGHEIGNHTFTHPKFDEFITHTEIRWQLNLTQRLIESTLGVKSILFRPPYGIDHQPEYAEEVAQLPLAQEMGYLIAGPLIDPDDCRMPDGQHPLPAQAI